MIYGGMSFGTLNDLEDCVDRTVEAMKGRIGEFESIVVRGVSGMIVGAPVAIALHKPLVVCRKPNEMNHDGATVLVNKQNMGEWVVFLDDFRMDGKTEGDVRAAVEAEGAWIGECFFYHEVLEGRRGQAGWTAPKVAPDRFPVPGLKIRHRGVLYPATIIKEARVRVLVSYNVPISGYSVLTDVHTVWLRRDDERLYWP